VFYSVVDDVDDNIDMEMWAKHSVKIAGAQDICETLFQGYYSRLK